MVHRNAYVICQRFLKDLFKLGVIPFVIGRLHTRSLSMDAFRVFKKFLCIAVSAGKSGLPTRGIMIFLTVPLI